MFGTGSPPRAILASIERPNLSAEPLDLRGQPWLLQAADWRGVLRAIAAHGIASKVQGRGIATRLVCHRRCTRPLSGVGSPEGAAR
jgi:hypothetical protein